MPVRRRISSRRVSASRQIVPKHRRGRVVRGGSLWSWIKDKALPWLKKTKIISSIGRTLGNAGVPWVGTLARGVRTMGYGRKRKGVRRCKFVCKGGSKNRRGSGLRLN